MSLPRTWFGGNFTRIICIFKENIDPHQSDPRRGVSSRGLQVWLPSCPLGSARKQLCSWAFPPHLQIPRFTGQGWPSPGHGFSRLGQQSPSCGPQGSCSLPAGTGCCFLVSVPFAQISSEQRDQRVQHRRDYPKGPKRRIAE